MWNAVLRNNKVAHSVAFHDLLGVSLIRSRHVAVLVPAHPGKGREQTGNQLPVCPAAHADKGRTEEKKEPLQSE
jgi:hypothetical protein